MLLFSAVLVCCANSALSGITTGPGVQRVLFVGNSAKFQWSVIGPISSFSVHNQTLGYPGPLNANADYMMDNRIGVVILIINNVQLSDVGNYSLSVTIGATTQTDASALLFVYGSSSIFVNQTSGGGGQQPATEGDAVELTCTMISNSLPVAYRPKVIYYHWYLPWLGELLNISSGQATLYNYGEPVPGYSIKNDGRTLVIASAQYHDTQGIFCSGNEQWSWYQKRITFDLPLKYRPYTYSHSPPSRKFNAILGDRVSLSFKFEAFPDVTSSTNWRFINTAGQPQNLPVRSSSSNSYSPYSLSFTLTSEAYYGNYSITIRNSIGAIVETFQVLGLGPPDPPSRVTVDFLSHYLIVISWNAMWPNGRQQKIFLQLKDMYNNSIIDTQNTPWPDTPVSIYTFNSTYYTQFQNGIHAESDYQVCVWSTNNLGSSDVVKLSVRSPKVFKFFVSPKTISINGNQAIVNFSATEGKIKRIIVEYCVELTSLCYRNFYYDVYGTSGQLKFDITQSGDVYVFHFTVYGGDPNKYLFTMATVKDVRVSRNGKTEEPDDEKPDDEKPGDEKPDDKKPDDDKTDDEKLSPLLIAVIVLAVLLGVAVLALIGCLIAFLIFKRRQSTQSKLPNNSQQPQENRYS